MIQLILIIILGIIASVLMKKLIEICINIKCLRNKKYTDEHILHRSTGSMIYNIDENQLEGDSRVVLPFE